MRKCFDVGVRFKGCAVSPHAHVVLVLFGERGEDADPAIVLSNDASAVRGVQLLVVVARVKRVATFLKPVLVIRRHRSIGVGVIVFPFWVVVVQQASPPHVLLVVWVLFHHEDFVGFRVRAAVHPAQVDGVVDVCPEVGPLIEVLKIGEVPTPVGVRKRDRDTVGVYDEYVVWRR